METRANYIAIGLFVLAVTAAALGFVYWLYATPEQGRQRSVEVIFPEAVTGLSTGSQVLFNGIRIGEVTRLGFPADGGPNVIAQIRVNEDAPVKTDTQATLGFQGLTGVAHVSLTGGSRDAPSLFAQEGEPTIRAKVSPLQSILQSGQTFISRADQTLQDINAILEDNRQAITDTVSNVRRFSEALSDSAPQISGLVEDVASAGRALAAAGPDIQQLVSRVDGLVAGISPDQVAQIVDDIARFTNEAAALPGEVRSIIGGVQNAVQDVQSFASGAERIVERARTIVAAVDPDAVSDIVSGVRTVTSGLADRSEAIGTLIENAGSAAGSIDRVASAVAERREDIGTIISDAAGIASELRGAAEQVPDLFDTLRPGIENLSAILTEIAPARIDDIVTNVQIVTAGIAQRSEELGALVDDASATFASARSIAATVEARNAEIGSTIEDAAGIARELRGAAGQVPELLETVRPGIENLNSVLVAVDPEAVSELVSAARGLVTGLEAELPAVQELLASARAIAFDVEAVTGEVAARTAQITEIINNADLTARNAETLTARLSGIAESARPGVENLGRALSAIDPEAVGEVVESARGLVTGIEAELPRVSEILADSGAAVEDVRALAETVADRQDRIATLIDDAAATGTEIRTAAARADDLLETIRPGIDNLNSALVAIEPGAIGRIVSDVSDVTSAFAERREAFARMIENADTAIRDARSIAGAVASRQDAIEETLSNARTFSARLNVIAEDVSPALASARRLIDAIDADNVNAVTAGVRDVVETVAARREDIALAIENARAASEDVRTVTATLAEQDEAIRRIVENVEAASTELESAIARVADTVETVGGAIEGPGVRFLEDGAVAAREIAAVARAFAERADSIAVGIDRFATGGLDDVRALVDQGERTLSRIERAVANFDAAPNRLLFGGERGPTYSPQRR